jgi:tetratricopeptide (TPR) repeat protein
MHDDTRAVVLRLMREDPSLDVAWAAAGQLAQRADDAYKLELRDLHLEDDARTPSVYLAARAWDGDPDKQNALFRRVLVMQAEHPAHDAGELSVAFASLKADARKREAWDELANLLRQQAWMDTDGPSAANREPDDASAWMDIPSVPRPLLELFALHAERGPLAGFAHDVEVYAAVAAQPPVLYAIGKTYEHAGQQLLATACFRAGYVASAGSQAERYATGVFLERQGWLDLAEPELEAVLHLDGPLKAHYDSNAHLRLAFISQRLGNDFDTAEHLRATMELLAQNHGMLNGTTDHDVWIEIHWRYFRAARDRHDDAAAALQANQVIDLAPTSPMVVLDLVPWLREHHRDAEAHTLFLAAYTPAKAALSADKPDAEKLNDLAWLCASCNEHLEEAIAMSEQALKLAPANAAYMDTLAEANFRLGRKDQAVRLETRALELMPNDAFMRKQLARFRGE